MEKPPIEFGKELKIETTPIPGLLLIDIPVHGDNRGWFKENWQRSKELAAGLPDFGPVQNNISFNAEKGVTRGIHAEPWDKYISVGSGRIFGAWVDLREGPSFGESFTAEIDPSKAIFVPRGVGNAFQALEDQTVYTYLVNDHWSADNPNYAFLNLADPTVNISWPIPLSNCELSDKDKSHPELNDVNPIKPRAILVTGANGQLGRALKTEFPDAEFVDRDSFDISRPETWEPRNWRQYRAIINTAAYTQVDTAETPEGRVEAWRTNAEAVRNLARIALENYITLVHVSSDYVFDGSNEVHTEEESLSPLGVYGQTKAAGDIAASTSPKHYITRTSWVVGDGNNFVKTMANLADKGVEPKVVNDQIGRLTFTEDLAKAIKYLLENNAAYGTYNVSNGGEPMSWADIASKVYEITGHNASSVTGVSTEDYFAGKENISPRPLNSTLSLDKLIAAGFTPREMVEALKDYLSKEDSK